MDNTERKYIPRLADKMLDFLLKSSGAVYIKGPKWCGKSTTAEQHAKSTVYMQDKEVQGQNMALAENAPALFLSGDVPRLIDEWQVIPFIWDSVRYEVDKRDGFGQFILTGSSVPLDEDRDLREHSGAGRIVPMTLRTMSLYESGDSSGSVSLEKLFNHGDQELTRCTKSLNDYSYLICRGGWPKAVTQTDREVALQQVRNYYEVLIGEDFQRIRRKSRGTVKVSALMRSYARNISTCCTIASIRRDIAGHGDSSIDEDTLSAYINDLADMYTIEELPAWNPNLRSKAAVSATNTRHFVDPSIGCAALDVWPEDLMNDLNTMGLFFESMAVRDLRIYSENIGGKLFHYRDSDGLEADAVIKLRNGKWAAVEVKLRSEKGIEEGAAHLLALRDKVDVEGHSEPEFLMLVTATEYAYRRKDGVYVVPLGCLGP